MKTSLNRSLSLVALAGLALVAGMSSARAEQDYDFAEQLMKNSQPSFNTDDLVERLIANLDQNPNTKLEAKLIKATYLRRQSRDASVTKRKDILDQVDILYSEVLAGPKNTPLYDIAEKEASTLNMDRVSAILKVAEENPAQAAALRADAVKTMQKLADDAKKEVDVTQPKFEEAFKKYKDWAEQWSKAHPDDALPRLPREIEVPLGKTFDEWIVADKKYVAQRQMQLECYDDKDPAKKVAADDLVSHCQNQIDHDAISEFPNIGAWYNFMLGRTYAIMQNETGAAEAWTEALNVDQQTLSSGQKANMVEIKRRILIELVKLKMDKEKYEDVVRIVGEALIEPSLKSLFEDHAGKRLLIDYANAMTKDPDAGPGEFQKAIRKLQELVDRESNQGARTVWANEFSRTMAEILRLAHERNIKPQLTAQEWYSAANGFFSSGYNEYRRYTELQRDEPEKAKEQFETAYNEFESAVDYYRRAITVARDPNRSDLLTRLTIEPKAWFEMGMCYIKMKHFYESIIVFQAMRNTFLPEFRKKWMPDIAKSEFFKVRKPIEETLAELDKEKEGLLSKSGTNVMYAFEQNVQVHNGKDDQWNRLLKGQELASGTDKSLLGEAVIKDPEYHGATNDMDLAKSAADFAKKQTDPKEAEAAYGRAAKSYISAGDKFMKVKADNAVELAAYQAGSVYTMAQSFYATGKLPHVGPEVIVQNCRDLAKKALVAFDQYDAIVAKSSKPTDEEKERRASLLGIMLLARSSLYCGVEDWEKVVKTSDDYLALVRQGDQQDASIDVALLNKLRALLSLAAKNIAPACDPYLQAASTTLDEIRKAKPKDHKLYLFLLTTLSSRYQMAVFQGQQLMKEQKVFTGDPEKDRQALQAYELKVTELQEKKVQLGNEGIGDPPTMDDYSRLVYLLNRTSANDPGRKRHIVDVACELLNKFDPEGKDVRIPDSPEVWQTMLTKMIGDASTAGVIKFADLNRWDRCKADHKLLVDYMYDTREASAYKDNDPHRPDFDRFNIDYEKALAQIQTIKNNYKDCQTLDRKYGENGKSFIEIIAEEIDFRRKIEASRDLVSTMALDVAEQLKKDNQEDKSKEYLEIANNQIKNLIALRGEKPQMKFKSAVLDVALGKYDQAQGAFFQILADIDDPRSTLYFDCKRQISEVYAKQGKWKEAAEYPEWLVALVGFDAPIAKQRWPEMKDFLERCYANGVPRPKEPLAPKAKPDAAKEGVPGEEALKADQAASDALKPADEANLEEKKADEAKPEEKKAAQPAAKEGAQ